MKRRKENYSKFSKISARISFAIVVFAFIFSVLTGIRGSVYISESIWFMGSTGLNVIDDSLIISNKMNATVFSSFQDLKAGVPQTTGIFYDELITLYSNQTVFAAGLKNSLDEIRNLELILESIIYNANLIQEKIIETQNLNEIARNGIIVLFKGALRISQLITEINSNHTDLEMGTYRLQNNSKLPTIDITQFMPISSTILQNITFIVQNIAIPNISNFTIVANQIQKEFDDSFLRGMQKLSNLTNGKIIIKQTNFRFTKSNKIKVSSSS